MGCASCQEALVPLVRRSARGAPNAVKLRTLHRPSRVIDLATYLKQSGSLARNMTRFSEMGVCISPICSCSSTC